MDLRRKKSKFRSKPIVTITMVLFFTILIIGCKLFQKNKDTDNIPDTSSEPFELTSDKREEEKLTVHFIDCGQGDAILISVKEKEEIHNALIDCGSYYNYDLVPDYLINHDAEKLDYFFITHFDDDHSGAGSSILKKIDVKNLIYDDKENESSSKYYLEKEITSELVYAPKVSDQFYLTKNCVLELLAPLYEYEEENNNSLVLKLSFNGKPVLLLTGDAEEESELDLVSSYQEELYAPVLKAGHHGSKTSCSEVFLDKVKPEAVIISCGEKNKYFHPHASVLNKFRQRGYKVYRTDEEGTIVMEVMNGTIKFNVPPSDSWKAGEGA